MLSVAYLAIEFPSPVEPYVEDEILELRRRGLRVVAGSIRRARNQEGVATDAPCTPAIILQPLRVSLLLRGLWICATRLPCVVPILTRVIFCGREGFVQRIKAVAHTALGAYYAAALEKCEITHIHVHHGYFGAWVGMVAAKLLEVGFSLTLHGSDLLLDARYLDVKIAASDFCFTVSEFNRQHIFKTYPAVARDKVLISRLGVLVERGHSASQNSRVGDSKKLCLLTLGRLHAVKNHAFLVRSCAELLKRGVDFHCVIAGDGPERRNLESLIASLELGKKITLLGHVPHSLVNTLFDEADIVTLTSRSEGIPLVLMEAMARGVLVLAPNITGIPELVVDGRTGFLYDPGSQESFLSQLALIQSLRNHPASGETAEKRPRATQLDWVRHAARTQVLHNYDQARNLELFGDLFLQRIEPQIESPREDFVLQQV
jgi:glycosyltransferase involved in cell wall biosynthesis